MSGKIAKIFLFSVLLSSLILMDGFARDQEVDETASGQRIQDFYFSNYKEEGTRDWEIEGIEAVIYDESIAIEYMKGKYYSGIKMVVVTSDNAVIDKATFNICLKDNVKIVSDDIEFKSNLLNWDKAANKIHTTDFVKGKKGAIGIESIGFQADIAVKTAVFLKDVKVNMPDDRGGEDVIITCDGPLDIDYTKEKAIFNNDVIARNEDSQLYGDKITVYFNTKEKIIVKIVAEGNVRINRNGNITKARKATYLAKEGRTILSGRPTISYIPSNKGLLKKGK